MSGVRRPELAAFLRARRERLQPPSVGLPVSGGRRQTPGLRRQEVAGLAGLSVDYYIRLEQGRGPNPSRQVVSALARALLLNADERDYLFRVSGLAPPVVAGPVGVVPPAILQLVTHALVATPAYVVDAKYDILAWNKLAKFFIGDLSDYAPSDRNMIRWMFSRPLDDVHWDDEQSARFARASVADLRVAYGRYPGDPGLTSLVTSLLATSPRFATLWNAHDVEERRQLVKRLDHPSLGPLEFECQVLHVPDTDQRLIVYVPEPGSPTEAAFRRCSASASRVPLG
ncbi:helix-turn-helix transcriptional regulator [Flindersiella endophytica]